MKHGVGSSMHLPAGGVRHPAWRRPPCQRKGILKGPLRALRFQAVLAVLLAKTSLVWAGVAGDEAPPVLTANELGVSTAQWTVENGLPSHDVRALAQTPDGLLWCGTARGLVRFDGVKFTGYGEESLAALDGLAIAELAVDGQGRLWIFSQLKQVFVMEAGRFRHVTIPGSFRGTGVLARCDPEGNVWFTARDGFLAFNTDSFVPRSFLGIGNQDVIDFHFAPDESVWALLGGQQRLTEISPRKAPRIISEAAEARGGRFVRMRDHSLALVTPQSVFQFQKGRWQQSRHRSAWLRDPIGQVEAACEDDAGRIWVGTYDQGLVVWLADGRLGNFTMGSDSVTWMRAVICDAEGNVWVGRSDGLFRLRPTAFRNWAEESGMERSFVHGLAPAPDGAMWFANGWELSCLRPKADRLERVPLPEAADKTWHVSVARDGTVWAGDLAGQLFRLVGREMKSAGRVTGAVTVIHEDGDAGLWIGSTEGLWRLGAHGFEPVQLEADNSRPEVRSMAEDSQGRLMVVASGKGILRREGDSWSRVAGVPEPMTGLLESLCADADGTVWVTLSTRGFARLRNGEWSKFEIATPNGFAAFEGIAADRDGCLWLPSGNGLFRVRRSHLAPGATSQVITADRQFDRNDGLGSVACTSVAYLESESGEGRIWVGTQDGAAVASLRNLSERRERSAPPKTLVEAVQWDDRPAVPVLWASAGLAAQGLDVPAGVLRLRISYTATKVQFPEKAAFQYRLLGLAEDWVQAGAEREATFLKLSPGRYEFQVRSANRHGDWNSQPAVLRLQVLPAWWQTVWFQAALGLVFAGLVWMAYAWRMRRLNREQALHSEFSRQLIRSQELERKRIAGELHDSLGQNLLVAKNLALLGLNGHADNAQTVKQFGDISQAVSAALSEARRISKALRPPELDRMGLTKALRDMVQRVGEASGIECKINMDDIDGLLPAADEINVYRLVQEAMNNVAKHSNASQAEIRVLHHPDHLELTVSDNGQGFEVSKLRNADSAQAGTGLTGMEERTRLAGGEFAITSQNANGTTVRICLPVKAPKE